MTPTNLPVQPATPATPASSAAAPAAGEQAQTADFLLMLGQLVAASVQRSGTALTPTAKVPSMVLDGPPKNEEVDPEEMLAMFAMAMHPQTSPLPIDVPVEQPLQGLPGSMAGAAGAQANVLQEVARQVTDAQLLNDIAADAATQGTDMDAPDSLQGSTAPFQLQQPQVAAQTTHTQAAIDRPVHSPVGSGAWAEEIGTRVVMMTGSGNHTASLKLSPEHLGPLEISITVRDDKASVWFGAAHADTRAAIETALPRLREMFEAHGLSLADAGVFREPPRDQQAVKNNMTSAERGGATEEVASVAVRARLGLVDAYA
jgi:flagellar hook-length control protein FliK